MADRSDPEPAAERSPSELSFTADARASSAEPPRPPESADDFVVSERTRAFRAGAYPDASDAEWNDWRWQLRHRVRDVDALSRLFALSESERKTVDRIGGRLPVGITPYYASLMDREHASCHRQSRHLASPTASRVIGLRSRAGAGS